MSAWARPAGWLWHLTPEERKVHREHLREARDARREASRTERYAAAGRAPPPRRVGRPTFKIQFRAPDMQPGSRPQSSLFDGERRFDCRRYNTCLQYAASQDWPGFGCSACPVDDPQTPEERVRDWGGLVALAQAAEGCEEIAVYFGIKSAWRRR